MLMETKLKWNAHQDTSLKAPRKRFAKKGNSQRKTSPARNVSDSRLDFDSRSQILNILESLEIESSKPITKNDCLVLLAK